MLKEKKITWVEKFNKIFASSPFAFVFRAEKVPSEEMLAIRQAIKTNGGQMFFVKNTLAKIATKGTNCEVMNPVFKEISILVVPKGELDEDAYPSLVKALNPFMKTHKKNMSVAGGVISGSFLDKAALEAFGKMPTRLEILGQIAFMCQYPLMNAMDTIKRAGESKQ